MDIYASDEEKVEELKKWWKENGRSLIVGVVVGLAAVFGWQAWEGHREAQRARASNAFAQMTIAVQQGESEQARTRADQLVQQFPDSAYAVFAALTLAKLDTEAGRGDSARQRLEWAAEHASTPGLSKIVTLRLARLLLAQGRAEDASDLVESVDHVGFEAAFRELEGDIKRQQGQLAEAETAYREALNKLQGAPGQGSVLQMKLDATMAAQRKGQS